MAYVLPHSPNSLQNGLSFSTKTQIKQVTFLTDSEYTAYNVLIVSTSTEVKKGDDTSYAAQSSQPVVVTSSAKFLSL